MEIIAACIALVAVVTAAVLTRGATRYSAHLLALQRVHDTDLQMLNEFGEAALEAFTQAQGYVVQWHLLGDDRRHDEVQFEALFARGADAVAAAQRADYLSDGLRAADDVRALFREAYNVVMDSMTGLDAGVIAWQNAIDARPNALERTMRLVGERRRDLVDSYPQRVPGFDLAGRLRESWVPARKKA